MKVLSSKHKLCISCMREHNVDIIETEEQITFKGMRLKFNATYEYCSNTEEYLENEDLIRANSLAVKDVYRKEVGLLPSNEIKNIREKYKISQKEFSEVLNWGKATITRYENHQIQDKAHDDILRKINSDPNWFLELLERSKDRISQKMYSEYYHNARKQCNKKNNPYSYSSISTNIYFNEFSLSSNNMLIDRCFTRPYKMGASSGFSYLAIPVCIIEKSICAN